MHLARSTQWNGRNLLCHTGFKAHSSAGGNVKPMTVCGIAVELQRGVGLRQVYMAAYLNRAVAGVHHIEGQPHCSGVDLDIAVAVQDLPRLHGIGWWTVTSLVPSGKVASTWTS